VDLLYAQRWIFLREADHLVIEKCFRREVILVCLVDVGGNDERLFVESVFNLGLCNLPVLIIFAKKRTPGTMIPLMLCVIFIS
jgi:hypothetical protein